MKPVSPVIPGLESHEIVFAKDQPEYIPLPALRTGGGMGSVVTHWKLSWRERIKVLLTGSLYLQQLTFNHALQPQLPTVDKQAVWVEGLQ